MKNNQIERTISFEIIKIIYITVDYSADNEGVFYCFWNSVDIINDGKHPNNIVELIVLRIKKSIYTFFDIGSIDFDGISCLTI